MSVSPGERYGRSFALGGPVNLWTTRNATLAAAATATVTPVTTSPVAGFSPCNQISYEITVNAQSGAGSTPIFLLVTLTWYNDDSLTAVPVDSVSWYLPVTASGSTVYPVTGHGPMRGQFMAVTVTSVTLSSQAITYTILLRGTSRTYARDDWRWQPGLGAAIPGFALPATSASQGTLVMAAAGPTVNQGAAAAVRMLPLFAGKVRLSFAVTGLTSNAAQVTIAPANSAAGAPPLYASPLVGTTPASGGPVTTVAELNLPRDCCQLTMANFAGGGGGNAAFQLVIVTEEY